MKTKSFRPFQLQYLPVAFSFPCSSGQSIGQCISGIYTWSLTVVGILAFFQIIYAGVMYLTAAGNASRIAQAKSKIFKAILGIIILFSSYLILYTINPDLVGGEFKLPILKDETEKQDYNSIYLQETIQPSAVKGQEYGSVIRPAGGTPPYTFEIVEGNLPSGLKMESNGEEATISGTPADQTPYLSPLDKIVRLLKIAPAEAAARDYTFKVKITDSQGKTFFETMTISVEIEDEIIGGSGDTGGSTPRPTRTESPPPVPGDFGKATDADFIKSANIVNVAGSSSSGSDVDANRLYGLSFELDTTKVSPLRRRFKPKEGQGEYLTMDVRVISSEPMEFILPAFVGGYPREWQKLAGHFNSELWQGPAFGHQFKGKNLNQVISENIKTGNQYIVDPIRWAAPNIKGEGACKLPQDCSGASFFARLYLHPKTHLFFPESLLGKTIELKVAVLGQSKDKKLIKDEEKITINVRGSNKPPVAEGSRSCATTVKKGEWECPDGSVQDASFGSPLEIYLASKDSRPYVSDPDRDKIGCFVLPRNTLEAKTFTKEQAPQPEGCDNPGKLWIRYATTSSVNTSIAVFNTFYAVTDGTLWSNPSEFGAIAIKEPGKTYLGDACDPKKDGRKIEVYFSGQRKEFTCGQIEGRGWQWLDEAYVSGGFTIGGCSMNVGQNRTLEYSSLSSKGKWKCVKAPSGASIIEWILQPISGQNGGGGTVVNLADPLIELLVSEELKVKGGDRVILRAKVTDPQSRPLTVEWTLLKIGAATDLNLDIQKSYNSNTKIAEATFIAPNKSILFWISFKASNHPNRDVFKKFTIDVSP